MRSNRLQADDVSAFHLLSKALAFQPTGPFASPADAGPVERASFTRFGKGLGSAIRERLAGEKTPAFTRDDPAQHPLYGQVLRATLDRDSAKAMFLSGWWMRAALISAVAAVSGAIFLFTGDVKPVPALALAVGGGLLAPYSMRRVLAIADRA